MVLCSPRPSRLAVRDSVPCSAIITPVRAQMWLTLGRSASVRLRRERVASTGPRPRGRGRGPYENKEYKDPTASTGPRPRGRGRSRRPPRSATSSALQRGRDHVVAEGCASAVTPNRASSFNGAATTWSRKASVRQQPGEQVPELQRGRDHVVAEGRARRERASRRSKLQRGRDHVVAEGLDRGCSGFPHLGFNGAATTWSRKDAGRCWDGRFHKASTGPRPRGRGRARIWSVNCSTVGRFNGAATTWSRKGDIELRGDVRAGGFNGAATTWSRKGGRLCLACSSRAPLQRGRDHVVAEGCQRRCRPAGRQRFNGAATTWSRKGPQRWPDGVHRGSFNGAATTWSRKDLRGANLHCTDLRFNGAATTWSRKAGAMPSNLFACYWLQRGRDHVVAEGRSLPRSTGGSTGFNGAATTWSRKAPHPGRPVRMGQRFNGAATTWSRKAPPPARRSNAAIAASTGPRPRGRGR